MTARPLRQARAGGRGLRVIQGAQSRHPVITPWIAFVLVVVVALCGIVLTRTTLDKGAFELAELDQQLATAQVRNQHLRLEIARLESPGRVAPSAELLGMVYPDERTLMTVDGVVVVANDPDPRWAGLDRYAAAASGPAGP